MATLGSLSVKLGLDPQRFRGGLASARASLTKFRRDVDNTSTRLAAIQTAFGGFGEYARKSVMSVTNLPLATEAIASVKSLSGAIGLIPAVAGAAGLAVGTLRIAFSGFGDAMKNIRDPKKFAEAIKEMPPPMQDTAKAVQSMLPQWDRLKKTVQSKLFADIAGDVKTLGGTYLPMLELNTGRTASSFNTAAHSVTGFLTSAKATGDVSLSMGRMATFTDGFARALKPAVQIFVDFVTVGSEFLPAMGDGLANAAEKAALFVRNARETGKLKAWIQEGIDTLKAFVGVIVNVGRILNGVLQAANVNGQGFAQTLERITARVEAWVRSAEGQERIRQVFDGLRNVAFALLAILGPLSTVIFALAGAFASLSPEMQRAVGLFVGWGGLVVLVGSKLMILVTALGPLIMGIGRLGAALIGVGPKLLTLIGWLARLALVGTMHVIRMVVMVTAQFLVMATVAVAHATRMAVTVAAQFAVMAATAIAHTVRTAAVVVAQWAIMAAGAMARAAVMAAAWLVAMGPVGWVIAAVVGLVALIIANWDTVVRWTKQAWSAVSGAVSAAWDWIKQATSGAVSWVIGKLGEMVRWVGGLPGRLMSALGNIGAMFASVGADLVRGIWNGIANGWSWLTGKVANLARSLFNAAKSALGISSPSRLFRWIGRMTGLGLVVGLDRSRRAVGDSARKLVSMVPTSLARMGNLTQQLGFGGGGAAITRTGLVATPGTQVPVAAGYGMGEQHQATTTVRLDSDTALGRLLMELIRKQTRIQGGQVQLVLGAG